MEYSSKCHLPSVLPSITLRGTISYSVPTLHLCMEFDKCFTKYLFRYSTCAAPILDFKSNQFGGQVRVIEWVRTGISLVCIADIF